MATPEETLTAVRKATRALLGTFSTKSPLWALGDVNGDGIVDEKDVALVKAALNKKAGEAGYDPNLDLNSDGVIDVLELGILNAGWGAKLYPIDYTIPGLPKATPGLTLRDMDSMAILEANTCQEDYTHVQILTNITDFFGGGVGDQMFSQPGWRARIDRAVQAYNAPWLHGVFPLLKVFWQNLYRPRLPEPQDLTRALARGVISPEEYLEFSGYLGLDDRYAADTYENSLQLPEWPILQTLRWRGIIDDLEVKRILLKGGLHPDHVDNLQGLTWLIPPPVDLIRFVVREVIIPEYFIEQMEKQGFPPGWSGPYWQAHFVLPPPQFLIDAFHRGVITDAELQKYIFWHDYQPTPRPDISKSDIEIMRSLTKTLIPRVDLRRGWEQGEVGDTELEQRYTALGYEEDAPLMARIQKAVALEAERAAVARQHLAALRKGFRSESEVRSRLKALRYPDQAINLLVETESMRREIGAVEPAEEPRVLSTAQILEGYRRGLFQDPGARALLASLGWDPEAVDVLLALNSPFPEAWDLGELKKERTKLRAAYEKRLRAGFMKLDAYKNAMLAMAYSSEIIEASAAAAEEDLDLEEAMELAKQYEDLAKAEMISITEYGNALRELGMTEERITRAQEHMKTLLAIKAAKAAKK